MDIEIGPLEPAEVDEADRIFRLAFATFLGLPDPSAAFGDSDMFRTRWRAANTRVLAARRAGVLVGTNVITRWGSLGWFGPMTVRPDLWDQGVARALLEATNRVFDSWKVTHRGLFTFANSPKHVSLYQRYGYWPRYLTLITERTLPSTELGTPSAAAQALLSAHGPRDAENLVRECRELSGMALPGLDLTGEIRSVLDGRLGDTVLLRDGSRLEGFAICYIGPGNEARSGDAYLKFGMVRPGSEARKRLSGLLDAVEVFASSRSATRLEVGVNTSHPETCRLLKDRGHRVPFIGVAMQFPDEPGYHRPDVAVLDDWR